MTDTTPTQCPSTARFRFRGMTIPFRCELPDCHDGHHTATQGEQTAMWGAGEPESEGGES